MKNDTKKSSAPALAVDEGSHLWPCPNGCHNWARCEPIDLRKPMPNHHSNCQHYNASLIDVWRVAPRGEKGGCICDTEAEAREMAGDDADLEITKQQMHRECFEQLGEFEGF